MTCRTMLLLVLLAAVAVIGPVAMYLHEHGFSAREQPNAIETWLALHARKLAFPADAKDLVNPVVETPYVLAEARDHYADHCAVCHGNRGTGKTMISEGLYPPPPDMRLTRTQSLTDGELFYIIKNGVRFTGMPGWGGSDEDNWKLAIFIRHLPKLSDKEFEFMQEINQNPE